MHATLAKFGYPETRLFETEHWCVVMRPQQVTLGALVLISKSGHTSIADLRQDAFAELKTVTKHIEDGLKSFRSFDKINYMMLMMVDPHVHFHVLPRYEKAQEFEGVSFLDPAWPGPPDLKSAPVMSDAVRGALLLQLTRALSV